MEYTGLTFKQTERNPQICVGACDHLECRYRSKPDYVCHENAEASKSLLNMKNDLPECSGSSTDWHPVSHLIGEDSRLQEIRYGAKMKAGNEVR